MRKPAKTANISGGMFAEFEPAPAAEQPSTAPLFDLPDSATVTPVRDYGKPEAPARRAVTGELLLETALVAGDGILNFGLADTDPAETAAPVAGPTSPAQATRMLRQIIGDIGFDLRSSHALDDNHLRTMVHVTSGESAEKIRAAALASELVDRVTAYNPASGFVVVHWTHNQA
jgi:hypothetical protein